MCSSVRIAAVKDRTSDAVPVFPTTDTIQAAEIVYPLARPLAAFVRQVRTDRLAPLFEVGMSNEGTAIVETLGYIPLTFPNRIAMLSRMDANGGTNQDGNPRCGASSTLPDLLSTSMHGLLVETFVTVYASFCPPEGSVLVASHQESLSRMCSRGAGPRVTAAITSRQLDASEATPMANGYEYECTDTGRQLIQIEFALDALVLATANNGIAHDCIDTLGGSLTMDQLRWMLSSLSTEERLMTGWNSSSVPNMDGDNSTFLWSELNETCEAEEIVLGFYHRSEGEEDGMGTAQDELMDFLASVVFVDANETFRTDSSLLLVSTDTLQALPTMVVATTFSVITREALPWSLIGIQNETNGIAIQPTTSTIQSRTYSPFLLPVYLNYRPDVLNLQLESLVSTFLLTPDGQQVSTTVGYVPLSETDEATMQERAEYGTQFRFCFSSNNTVQVRGKGTIPMAQVRIGDYIRSSIDGRFDRVYTFGHRNDHAEATFHRISLLSENRMMKGIQNTSTTMELTKDHLVLSADGSFVRAGELKVDDLLLDENGNELVVHQIELVQSRGVYAPFTESGTIVVNGCVASVYANIQHRAGLDTNKDLFVVVGGIGTISFHTAAHMAQAPHRIFCRLWFDICKDGGNVQDGMSVWPAWQLSLFDYLFGTGMPNMVQWLVAIPVGLFVLTFAMIEVLLFGSSIVWMATAVVGLVATITTTSMAVPVGTKRKTVSAVVAVE